MFSGKYVPSARSTRFSSLMITAAIFYSTTCSVWNLSNSWTGIWWMWTDPGNPGAATEARPHTLFLRTKTRDPHSLELPQLETRFFHCLKMNTPRCGTFICLFSSISLQLYSTDWAFPNACTSGPRDVGRSHTGTWGYRTPSGVHTWCVRAVSPLMLGDTADGSHARVEGASAQCGHSQPVVARAHISAHTESAAVARVPTLSPSPSAGRWWTRSRRGVPGLRVGLSKHPIDPRQCTYILARTDRDPTRVTTAVAASWSSGSFLVFLGFCGVPACAPPVSIRRFHPNSWLWTSGFLLTDDNNKKYVFSTPLSHSSALSLHSPSVFAMMPPVTARCLDLYRTHVRFAHDSTR